MVQLKVRLAIAEKIKRDISIPYGSIKSIYLLLHLQSCCRISIPYGSIKSAG